MLQIHRAYQVRERKVDPADLVGRDSLTAALGHFYCIIDSFPAGLAKKTLPSRFAYQLPFFHLSSLLITYCNI